MPGRLRGRLWFGVAGAAAFLTTSCAVGAVRPEYDAWHQSISALSLGPDGWLQAANFIVFGAIVLSTVPIWRRILVGGIGATAFPVLTALAGASLILAAFLPQDPAPGYDPMRLGLMEPTVRGLLHLFVAGVGAGCSIAGLVVMARRLAGDRSWKGWSAYTMLMSVVMTACIVVYAIWSTAPSGFAGTFERIGVMVVPLWGLTFVRQLGKGRPFMRTMTR